MDMEQATTSQSTSTNSEVNQDTNNRCKSRRARRKRLQQRLETDQAKPNISDLDTDIKIHYSDQLDYINIIKTLPPKLQSVPCQTLPIPNIDLNTVVNEMEPGTYKNCNKQKSNVTSSTKTKKSPPLTEVSKDDPKIKECIPAKIDKVSITSNTTIPETNETEQNTPSSNLNDNNIQDIKTVKTREEILAEREAKKAIKLAKKEGKKINDSAEIQKSVDTVDNVQINLEITEISNLTKKVDQIKIVPGEGEKSKAELKAERRQKQEAQRAAKTAAANQGKVQNQSPNKSLTVQIKSEINKVEKSSNLKIVKKKKKTLPAENRIKLFSHLYKCRSIGITDEINNDVATLGAKYAFRVIVGSNARCIALIHRLKQLISDYENPPTKDFRRGLASNLKENVAYLEKCRPISVSMFNAFKHLKWHIVELPITIDDNVAKQKLNEILDKYLKEQIYTAGKAISNSVLSKISNGDVILTDGCSSLVLRILIDAHNAGKKFEVNIINNNSNGINYRYQILSQIGIDCTFINHGFIYHLMKRYTKVILGAHSLLINGCVMSTCGNSDIALLANAHNVPVLICCETHKFCNRVSTDSFEYNEINILDAYKHIKPISRKSKNYSNTNLTYDITEPSLVTAVVTELAILPCSSVPVILRIRPADFYRFL